MCDICESWEYSNRKCADVMMPLRSYIASGECFLIFSVLVANPKKLLYTVADPAHGLLNRENRTKEKVWQRNPPPPSKPHAARTEEIH